VTHQLVAQLKQDVVLIAKRRSEDKKGDRNVGGKTTIAEERKKNVFLHAGNRGRTNEFR
jgi:hypothetical protein